MLETGKMAGFLLTKDYEKAREFYAGKLGFEFVNLDQYALVVRVGGHATGFRSRSTTLPFETESSPDRSDIFRLDLGVIGFRSEENLVVDFWDGEYGLAGPS
ncbi:MAG: hypothetical protein WA755_12695 [Candidatus Acidiferrales bacterium]